jgi:DNA-binding CsgD family transcriptional regulator
MARNGSPTGAEAKVCHTARSCLRALVRDLGDDLTSNDDMSEQLLMDIDLDGQRYLLIRMPAVARKSALLSPREIEIVRLVAEGHPNKVIAAVLEISSWTVCTHMRRVFAKLAVTSRAAMIARLAETGGVLDGISFPSFRRAQQSGDSRHETTSWPTGDRPSSPADGTRSPSFTPHTRVDRPQERFQLTTGGMPGDCKTREAPPLQNFTSRRYRPGSKAIQRNTPSC